MTRFRSLALALLLAGCAPSVAVKKDRLAPENRISVVRIDGPVQAYNYSAFTAGLFGAIGGAVAGAIDGIAASKMTARLTEKVGAWSLPEEIEQNFIAALKRKVPWTLVSAGELDEETRTLLKEYIGEVDDNKTKAGEAVPANRADHSREQAARKKRHGEVADRLAQAGIDRILVLRFNFWGYYAEMGRGDYCIRVATKLIDPRKPADPIWRRSVDTWKTKGVSHVMNFNDEMERTPEEIQGMLRLKGEEVVTTLASDFN